MPTNTQLLQLAGRCAANAADAKYMPLIEGLTKRIEELETKLNAVPQAEPSPKNDGLYKALREKRTAIATALSIPAYCIASNRALEDIATQKPTTLEGLRKIKGFGPNNTKSYGMAFLRVVSYWS
jgi:superfamily II DNA helicase RecQ